MSRWVVEHRGEILVNYPIPSGVHAAENADGESTLTFPRDISTYDYYDSPVAVYEAMYTAPWRPLEERHAADELPHRGFSTGRGYRYGEFRLVLWATEQTWQGRWLREAYPTGEPRRWLLSEYAQVSELCEKITRQLTELADVAGSAAKVLRQQHRDDLRAILAAVADAAVGRLIRAEAAADAAARQRALDEQAHQAALGALGDLTVARAHADASQQLSVAAAQAVAALRVREIAASE